MGRPKGSRNKKRKYTRRKIHNGLVPVTPDHAGNVLSLVGEVKDQLMQADPDVAREAIPVLVEELTWLAKLIEGVPPAP